MSKFCAYCGKAIQETGTYCPYCGKRIPSTHPTAVPPSAPAIPVQPNVPAPSVSPVNKPKKNSTAYTVLTVIGAVIMLIGVIVAFAAGELVSTHLYDEITGIAPAGVGLHVFVIMLFVIVSDALYLIANLKCASIQPNVGHWAFHGAYALTGLFLSLGTAYAHRASGYESFYNDMLSAPSWYSGHITGNSWFFQFDDIANRYSGYASLFYVLMIIGIGGTIACYVWARRKNN